MQSSNEEVIVPASEILEPERVERPWPRRRRRGLPIWVRLLLLLLAGGWLTVFTIAALLNPYNEDGTPRRMETHRQMGLPECTFKHATGLPCPSCGMTTSFSLLIHGDVLNSLQANCAGTILASLGLLYIPWSVLSAWRGRFLFVNSLEVTLFKLSIAFIILLFGRWAFALAMAFWGPGG